MVNGTTPILYTEIKAWTELTGIGLNLWEVETFGNLSRMYLVTAQESSKEHVPPPFMTEDGLKAQQRAYALQRKAALTRGK